MLFSFRFFITFIIFILSLTSFSQAQASVWDRFAGGVMKFFGGTTDYVEQERKDNGQALTQGILSRKSQDKKSQDKSIADNFQENLEVIEAIYNKRIKKLKKKSWGGILFYNKGLVKELKKERTEAIKELIIRCRISEEKSGIHYNQDSSVCQHDEVHVSAREFTQRKKSINAQKKKAAPDSQENTSASNRVSEEEYKEIVELTPLPNTCLPVNGRIDLKNPTNNDYCHCPANLKNGPGCKETVRIDNQLYYKYPSYLRNLCCNNPISPPKYNVLNLERDAQNNDNLNGHGKIVNARFFRHAFHYSNPSIFLQGSLHNSAPQGYNYGTVEALKNHLDKDYCTGLCTARAIHKSAMNNFLDGLDTIYGKYPKRLSTVQFQI